MHNQCVLPATRPAVPEISVIRRQNILAVYKEFLEEAAAKAVAKGVAPRGLETEFAAILEISPSMWSQIKSGRLFGDKLARQLEHRINKPRGWLDELHEPHPAPTPAEEAFVLLARQTWREQNAKGKRDLRRLVQRFRPEE